MTTRVSENIESIFVISHQRSGTHLTIDSIINNLEGVSDEFLTVPYNVEDREDEILRSDAETLSGTKGSIIVKSHFLPRFPHFTTCRSLLDEYTTLYDKGKHIYVYRDGRDVMVSFYYFVQKSTVDISGLSFSDFIRMESAVTLPGGEEVRMNRVEYWAYHVRSWLAEDGVTALPYEDFKRDYEGTVRRLSEVLAIPLKGEVREVKLPSRVAHSNRIFHLIYKVYRSLFCSGEARSSAVSPRRGVVGDWRSHFSEEDLRFFHENDGGLLGELGYE